MPRPVPYSTHMAALARKIQKEQKSAIINPTLLAVDQQHKFAVVAGKEDPTLCILNLETNKVQVELELPSRCRSGLDFRNFQFSDDHKYLCGYMNSRKTFILWNIENGKVAFEKKGEGKLNPTCCFLPNELVAVADGPRINIYKLDGDQDSYVTLSKEMESVTLFSATHDPGLLALVASFKQASGKHVIVCFHIKDGSVASSGEGPTRDGSTSAMEDCNISLKEMMQIPGATSKILIILEEETREAVALDESEILPDHRYVTRLMALDPANCRFYEDEITFEGRYCLEISKGELHFLDEWGRRRRVNGFPMKVENIDWRLEGV